MRARISTPIPGPAIQTLVPTAILIFRFLQTWGKSREVFAR